MNLTVQEVAERLQVTPARVRQFLVEGRLRGTKFGRDWLITEAEAQRFALEPRPITGRPPTEAP